MNERLVGRKQVADMWNVSLATLERLESAGIIPRRRRIGRGRVAWLLSELEAALRALPPGPLTERTAVARAARRRKTETPNG